MTKKYAIGIDLGTTYSCVGVFRNDNIEIFQNNEGFRITPSCVSFDDEEVLVGNSAVYQSETNIKNTIFNIKRIIGRDFDEENVQNDIKRFPFKVINKNNRPYVQVKYKRNIEEYTPEEISSNILSEMKGIAEDYLGEKIADAVITVPAYFNDTQRKATIDAGKIAGLNVLQIINEPTAAALAYGFNNKIKSIENILVIDLGGGTYDISLLSIINGKYEVKAISGDTHFGGEDFNERLIDYFIEEIKTKYRKDIRSDSNYFKIKNRLKSACERCKIQLSSKKCKMASIEIVNIFDGINFKSNLTRARFEELNKDLFDKLLKPIKDVINFTKINKSDVNEIVLIGGSTRIPKVQDIISSYFDGKELKKKINPDEAVAYGAAILASNLSNENQDKKEDFISDVVPLSLGTAVKGNIMNNIIYKNSKIPVKKTERYITMYDNQTSVSVEVCEGENLLIANNKLLDKFILEGITPRPRGEAKIDVTFEINKNGVLKVSASEIGTSLYNEITVINNKGRLYQEEINKLIMRSNENRENERKIIEKKECINALEEYAYELRNNFKNKPESFNKTRLLNAINETLKCITNYSIEECNSKKAELKVLSITVS